MLLQFLVVGGAAGGSPGAQCDAVVGLLWSMAVNLRRLPGMDTQGSLARAALLCLARFLMGEEGLRYLGCENVFSKQTNVLLVCLLRGQAG